MDYQLILDIFIAFSVVLILIGKYRRAGFIIGGVSFSAQAVFSYVINDPLLSVLSVFAAVGFFYELTKIIRSKDYHLDKKTRFIIGTVILLLGIWQTVLGTLSPYLIAGIIAAISIILERRK
jgi:hypothetical protein